MNRYDLAFAMFMRRCQLDECEPALSEVMWTTDVGVRNFWYDEANFVLALLAEEAAA